MKTLGFVLIGIALVLQPFAVAWFTATSTPPGWLVALGVVGFWGFGPLILTGIVLVFLGRKQN